jgi:DNA polymerase III epsilon subunit-like protein
MRVLVFDTETTGLPKSKMINKDTLSLWPYIVQFSYVIYNDIDNKIESIVDSVIKIPEQVEITQECTNIHGITKEICDSKGILLKDVLFQFIEDFQKCDVIIGHNIHFDLNMIKVEILRLSETLYYFEKLFLDDFLEYFYAIPKEKIYCTMQSSIELCGIKKKDKFGKEYNKFPKLMELYFKLFEIVPKNLHNSLNDVLICLRCFYKLKYELDVCKINKEINNLFLKFDL